MKLLFFDDYKLGVLKGNDVVDVSGVVADIPHVQPQDLIKGLIERWDGYKGKLESAVASGSGKPLSSVKIRAPLPKPATVACMAVNYLENHTMPEPAPINAFLKSGHCVGFLRAVMYGSLVIAPSARSYSATYFGPPLTET